MSEDKNKKSIDANIKVDVPGLKELADGTKDIAKDSAEGLTNFLGALCMPVAEQLGGLLSDQVKYWRHGNFIKYTAKTKILYEKLGVDSDSRVHPRVMLEVSEGVMKQEDDELLDWWAGITVAACEDCPTDEDIVFINKMETITCLQAKILKHVCTKAEVSHTSRGLFVAADLTIPEDDLYGITGESDVDRLDREIDSLSDNGLIFGGFDTHKNELTAVISPTTLGLQFYARCQGTKSNLIDFYSSTEMTKCPRCGRVHK